MLPSPPRTATPDQALQPTTAAILVSESSLSLSAAAAAEPGCGGQKRLQRTLRYKEDASNAENRRCWCHSRVSRRRRHLLRPRGTLSRVHYAGRDAQRSHSRVAYERRGDARLVPWTVLRVGCLHAPAGRGVTLPGQVRWCELGRAICRADRSSDWHDPRTYGPLAAPECHLIGG